MSELAHTLGQWFQDVGNVVGESGGTNDQFVGYSVLAYWSRESEDGRMRLARTLRLAAVHAVQAMKATIFLRSSGLFTAAGRDRRPRSPHG